MEQEPLELQRLGLELKLLMTSELTVAPPPRFPRMFVIATKVFHLPLHFCPPLPKAVVGGVIFPSLLWVAV